MSTGGWTVQRHAGAKRRLTFVTALFFLLSLLLQYAVAPVAAVHDEGIFELDGNATDNSGVAGDDWQNGTPGAADTLFIPMSAEGPGPDVSYFHGGGSKDENPLSQWGWASTDVAPDKDELMNVFAAVYENGADTLAYFGSDKRDDSGDAQIGFWFFQDDVSLNANGNFNGTHTQGDVLILSDFTNGGEVDLICVYEWNPTGDGDITGTGCDENDKDNLDLVAAGAECDVSTPDGSFDVCAAVNPGTENAGTAQHPEGFENAYWAFTNKDGHTHYDKGQFFEGGINLSQLFGGDAPCFSTFLAETRSSQETDAQLKDFALGDFNTCVPPDLSTESSVSEADFGAQVTDTATLSGSHGAVHGTVQFYICGPADVTASGCPIEDNAHKVGAPVTIVSNHATSPAFTVGSTAAAVGTYCWRAHYTPSADSEYLATSHTDGEDECFVVAPAAIDVEKEADAASVNAGEQIGFTVTLSNTGANTALGVSFTDNLPSGSGVSWSISPASAGWSITGAAPNQALVFAPTSLAAGASTSVHIVSNTTAASCKTYNNTASVTTTNDGQDSDSASTQVRCAAIDVEKEADAASVNAGEQIGFTVTLSNTGDGLATGLAFTDNLPSGTGVSWSISPASAGWSITGSAPNQQLVYSPTTLAAGASTSVHIVSNTTKDSCKIYNNTASVTTGNDGQDSDSASTQVLCASIDVEKAADAESVNAGEQIGFTVTLSNNGDGVAKGLAFTDALPAGTGVSWSISPASAGWSISGSAPNQTLVYSPTTLAAHASTSVHVVSATTKDSCKVYDNTASVTTTNDGSDSDSASTEVLCADIDVEKEADAASVNAGEQIGFTVTLSNTGEGTATGVAFTDNLPGGAGVSWSISPASAGWSITGSAPNQQLVYSPTTLAAGASTSVHVVSNTTKDSCKVYDNTASVTTGNDGSDSDSASTEVLCADVDVEKDADAASVNAGEQIGFTVTLSNTGKGMATGLSFTDNLPAGTGVSWSISPASAGWSITGSAPNQQLVYSPTTLAAGASTSVHVVSGTTKDSCKVYDNTASVSAANDGSDSDSASTEVLCADIDVEKTADANSVSAGEQIGFTVTLSNTGEGTATGLSFTDNLPGGPGVSWSISPASAGWSITGSAPSQQLVYSPTTLAAGASTSVHVVSNTTAASCKTYDNTASVTTGNDGSDSDSAETQVRCADIDVEKEADAKSVNAGEQIGFTVTIANFGEGLATGLSFSDSLPAGNGVSWSIESQSAGNPFSITGSAPNQTLVFAPTSMAAGGSAWVHIVSNTTKDSCKVYDNTASISTGNDGSDSDSDTTEVLCADVDVEKEADDASVNAGEQIGFTVTLSNTGEGDATGLTFTDNLPAGNGVSWSIDPASAGWSITGSAPTQQLVYSPTTLAAGASTSVHIVSDTTAESCKVYDNTASVSAANDGSDSSSDATAVLCPDVTVDKEPDEGDQGSALEVGGLATFTIRVSNVGNGMAKDVTLTDNLPDGIDWSVDSELCTITPDVGTIDQVLDCNFGSLGAEDSVTIHVSGLTNEDVCGPLPNTADVAASNEAEEDTDNNSDDGQIMVECPELAIDKTVAEAEYTAVGQVLHYTIIVTNVGNVTLHDVVVTDPNAPDIDCDLETPGQQTSGFEMDPGEFLTCAATHTITQDDLDLGFYYNQACTDDGNGDGEVGANPVCDDVTVFGQEVQQETDVPTQPNTSSDTFGGPSGPADGSWIMVLALATLLASIVLVTPRRGRQPR